MPVQYPGQLRQYEATKKIPRGSGQTQARDSIYPTSQQQSSSTQDINSAECNLEQSVFGNEPPESGRKG